MKKYHTLNSLRILLVLLPLACEKSNTNKTQLNQSEIINTLTNEEKEAGWELLFDGVTLNGWKQYNRDSISALWKVKNGTIVCASGELEENGERNGGSLMTVRQFENFELTADWKVSERGNSGILYHVVERPEFKYDYETGPEYQLLDDEGWRKDSLKDTQKTGSYYDMFAPSADATVEPAGEWNTSRIVYNNGYIEHWLNGKKIVTLKEHDQEFEKRYKQSKWTNYPSWNKFKSGSISLQEHGTPVYFKNIKVKVFN